MEYEFAQWSKNYISAVLKFGNGVALPDNIINLPFEL